MTGRGYKSKQIDYIQSALRAGTIGYRRLNWQKVDLG